MLNEGLYYGKENLMGEGVTRFLSPEEIERYRKEEMEAKKNKGEERPMVNDAKVKGSMYLQTIHDKELLEESQRQIEILGLDRNSASDCQKAQKEANKVLKVKKVKPKRFHVDLSPEMGQDLSDLAEKMGLTLNAVVKLFLMDDWQKLKVSGFDYIYLGIADRPKAPGEIPF